MPEEGQAAVGATRLVGQFDDESEGVTLVEVHVALRGEGALHDGQRMESEPVRKVACGRVNTEHRARGAEAETDLIGVSHRVVVRDPDVLEGLHVLRLAEAEKVVAIQGDRPVDGVFQGRLLSGDQLRPATRLVAGMQADLNVVIAAELEQAADVAPVKVVVRAILHVVSTGAEEEDRPTVVSAEDGAHAVVLLQHPGKSIVRVILQSAEMATDSADEMASEQLARHAAQGAAEEGRVNVVREVDLAECGMRFGGYATDLAQQPTQQAAVIVDERAAEEAGAMGDRLPAREAAVDVTHIRPHPLFVPAEQKVSAGDDVGVQDDGMSAPRDLRPAKEDRQVAVQRPPIAPLDHR